MNAAIAWLRRALRYRGLEGRIWLARDRLAEVLTDVPPAVRAAYGDVLPSIDALLDGELPRVRDEATFLRRYLGRQDQAALREQVKHWERQVYQAEDPGLRAVRQRNLELAQAQEQRIGRLTAALQRSDDQLAGLALAIEETASRIAAARLEGPSSIGPELQRLRDDIDALADELEAIHAGL